MAQKLFDKASLVMIPSQYKEGKIYNIKPEDQSSSFEFERGGGATRVNSNELIENVNNNTPRLDYSGTEPSLLLEPQRTNLFTDSIGFIGLSHFNLSQEFVSITSPEGNTNAVKKLTVTGTAQARMEESLIPANLNNNYYWSVFVKKDTARYVGLSHFTESGNRCIFDLDNGTIVSEGGGLPAKIEALANGWFRISKGVYLSSGVNPSLFKFHLCDQSSVFSSVLGESAFVYGFQIEQGSYATSYIPTNGQAETRLIDDVSSLDMTSITGDAFTVFIDYKNAQRQTPNTALWMYLKNTSNQLLTYVYGGTLMLHSTSGENYTNFTFGDGKVAFVYDGTNVKYFLNGTLVKTVTASTRWDLGAENYILYNPYNNTTGSISYNSFVVFSEALTDTELQQLTNNT